MKGRAIQYLPQELAWIEARKEMPRDEMHALFCAYWDRDDVSLKALNGLCKRKGWLTGRTGCFSKGITPHNKGKAMPDHVKAKVMATTFKPGNEPHNTRFLGHERLSKEGYVEVSVAEVNPHTGYGRRYVLKHRHQWEQINGPVPDDHVLKCLDGDKANTDPSNWEAIPRALLPRLAGVNVGIHYDSAPSELKPSILAVAKLDHAVRQSANP